MTGMSVESDVVVDAIRQYCHADNPSSFFAVNTGNSYFHLPDEPGVIVYRPGGPVPGAVRRPVRAR